MTCALHESAPLDLSLGPAQYLYGTNEMIPIVDLREEVMSISDVMTLCRHPQVKAPMSSGRKVDYIASRRISVPVNRENVIKSGILDSKYESQIPDSIILNISKDKDYITKPELFMLDLLSNYQWDRPICLLSMGGDLNIGIKEYFEYNGFSFQLVPIKNKTTSTQAGFVDSDALYRKMTEVYKWDALAEDDYFIDYQNEYTFLGVLSQRNLFTMCADVFIREGQKDRALEMLSKCEQVMRRYPLETISLGFSGNDYMVVDMVNQYYALGLADKAREIAKALGDELLTTAAFYLEFYDWGRNEFELAGNYIYLLSDALKNGGDEALGKELTDKFVDIVNSATGS